MREERGNRICGRGMNAGGGRECQEDSQLDILSLHRGETPAADRIGFYFSFFMRKGRQRGDVARHGHSSGCATDDPAA